jgi:hypothetical protein
LIQHCLHSRASVLSRTLLNSLELARTLFELTPPQTLLISLSFVTPTHTTHTRTTHTHTHTHTYTHTHVHAVSLWRIQAHLAVCSWCSCFVTTCWTFVFRNSTRSLHTSTVLCSTILLNSRLRYAFMAWHGIHPPLSNSRARSLNISQLLGRTRTPSLSHSRAVHAHCGAPLVLRNTGLFVVPVSGCHVSFRGTSDRDYQTLHSDQVTDNMLSLTRPAS